MVGFLLTIQANGALAIGRQVGKPDLRPSTLRSIERISPCCPNPCGWNGAALMAKQGIVRPHSSLQNGAP